MKPLRLAVLVSGRGSNLQAIIDSIKIKYLNAVICVVISDNPGALALGRAKKNGIPAVHLGPETFEGTKDYERAMADLIQKYKAELIVLAGYMRLISPYFLNYCKNRVVNIHPSLLPAFPGLEAQKQALDYGVRYTGCTVHFVDEKVDHGPIILQRVVPVYPDDTEETLSERILKEEHQVYPEALQLIAEGRVEIRGRRVRIETHSRA